MSDNGKVPAIHSLNKKANDLACENDILTNRVKVLEEALRGVLRVSRGTSGRIILEAEDELEARKALEADNG